MLGSRSCSPKFRSLKTREVVEGGVDSLLHARQQLDQREIEGLCRLWQTLDKIGAPEPLTGAILSAYYPY